MIYLIGGRGFLGSAFKNFFITRDITHKVITSENFNQFNGSSCDLLINANGNSKKYLSDQDPIKDFEISTFSVIKSLVNIHSKKYIYLSTGDVYPNQDENSNTSEDQYLDPSLMSKYGLHKYISESLVKRYSNNWLIFRLGGMVGLNLKKNPIFDICNNIDLRISSKSEMQYISTEKVASIVYEINQNYRNEIFNLSGSGTVLISSVFEKVNSRSKKTNEDLIINYSLDTSKIEKCLGTKLPNSKTEIDNFLKSINT